MTCSGMPSLQDPRCGLGGRGVDFRWPNSTGHWPWGEVGWGSSQSAATLALSTQVCAESAPLGALKRAPEALRSVAEMHRFLPFACTEHKGGGMPLIFFYDDVSSHFISTIRLPATMKSTHGRDTANPCWACSSRRGTPRAGPNGRWLLRRAATHQPPAKAGLSCSAITVSLLLLLLLPPLLATPDCEEVWGWSSRLRMSAVSAAGRGGWMGLGLCVRVCVRVCVRTCAPLCACVSLCVRASGWVGMELGCAGARERGRRGGHAAPGCICEPCSQSSGAMHTTHQHQQVFAAPTFQPQQVLGPSGAAVRALHPLPPGPGPPPNPPPRQTGTWSLLLPPQLPPAHEHERANRGEGRPAECKNGRPGSVTGRQPSPPRVQHTCQFAHPVQHVWAC